MRLGLIGDVHAEDERLRVALGHLAMRVGGVERILCTGNVVDGQGDVDRACALLASHDVLTIRGRHDRWIRDDMKRDLPNAHRMTSLAPDSIAFVKSLEATATIETPRGRLVASNADPIEVLLDPAIAILIGAQKNEPRVKRLERGPTQRPLFVVNPGTLVRDKQPGFAVIDLANAKVEFYRIRDSLEIEPASRAVL